MLIKNNKNLIITFFILLFSFTSTLFADEFDISAKEILIDKEKEVLTGTGSVEAIDSDGKRINADKIVYNKNISVIEV